MTGSQQCESCCSRLKPRASSLKSLLLAVLALSGSVLCASAASAQEEVLQGRVVFAHARDVGDKAGAQALAAKCRQAGFNVIVLQVKEPDGAVYFNSERFMGARAPSVAAFDPLAAVLKAAREQGLTVHAGLCAFLEGPRSLAANDHPEWAALTPRGKTTAQLAHSPGLWMCPARHPGYAEGYLIPMIEELLKKYAVDGIHLDHLSFPGEVGPDSYCFCDYCVREFPRRSRLLYPALPGARFEPPRLLPDPLANWASGATALPAKYDPSARKLAGEYMLKGAYIRRGPSDMNYFFYTYRTDAISDFCARAYQRARAISPKVQFSARVYWNAPAAGRFAGQRWTGFAQWFDFLVLDMGRSYLPGDFETYRKLLVDVASYAAQSSQNLVYIYAGLDVEGIYRRERESLQSMLEVLTDLAKNPGKDPRLPATRLAAAFEDIRAGLTAADEERAKDLENYITSMEELVRKWPKPEEIYTRIGAKVKRLVDDPPAGFYMPGKLAGVLQGIRAAGVNSVALSSASAIGELKLWNKLPEILGPAGREPYQVRPLRAPSVQTLRLFLEKQEQLASASAQIELLKRRLGRVAAELEPLRATVDDYGLVQKEKLEKLEGARLELEAISKEYALKLAELEKIGEELKATPGAPAPGPGVSSPDLEPPAEDADYATLRRELEKKIEQLKIVIGQRERAEELAMKLTVEVEKAHADLMEQKQELLYYISILIALACIGLAFVLVVSLLRHHR